jgi:uncharacterized membrane protein
MIGSYIARSLGKGYAIYDTKWKTMLVGIAAIASIMTINTHVGIAFADPQHCDKPGWPSCYSVGFDNGKANPGTSCSGHSKNYCRGWEDGSGSSGGSNGSGNRGGGQSGYSLTVNVPSHPFGESSVNIQIRTENGYTQSVNVGTAGGTSYTFNIPADQGNSVQVCVYTGFGIVRGQNCRTWTANGNDITVNQSAP